MFFPKVWIITDGKAGDLGPCLALAHTAHWEPEVWRLTPSGFLTQFMGPYEITRDDLVNQKSASTPRNIPSLSLNKLYPPSLASSDWPDVLIASGRRTIPVVRLIRKWGKGKTFIVFLKDPRTLRPLADFTWVFEHDPLRGKAVYATLTTPHALSPAVLQDLRTRVTGHPEAYALPHPRVAVLVGGKSRHHVFTTADQTRLINQLRALMDQGYHLMITSSRRTPPHLRKELLNLAVTHKCLVWDGIASNPYATFLALADYIIVTTDSLNMMGEALATGKPLLLFEPQGGHRKITQFTQTLKKKGYASSFHGSVTGTSYPPVDSTSDIATRMLDAFMQWHNARKESVSCIIS